MGVRWKVGGWIWEVGGGVGVGWEDEVVQFCVSFVSVVCFCGSARWEMGSGMWGWWEGAYVIQQIYVRAILYQASLWRVGYVRAALVSLCLCRYEVLGQCSFGQRGWHHRFLVLGSRCSRPAEHGGHAWAWRAIFGGFVLGQRAGSWHLQTTKPAAEC
jgi:hypothetical protein